MRALFLCGALAAGAVIADQWIKYLVEANLEMHQPVDILPFLALYRTYNTGVAFSMFAGAGDLPLIILSIVVIGFVMYLALRSAPEQTLSRIGFALIIGGALGNLIDRWSLGHVIDYILFHTPSWSFAVFNLADAFISVGAAMVVLDEVLSWWRQRTSRSSD